MVDTFEIEDFPFPEEGKHELLGYLLGALIVGHEQYTAKIHFYFERAGTNTIFVLEDSEQNAHIIDEISNRLKDQLLIHSRYRRLDVKLIVENKDGYLKIDMP
tara:strand:- start:105 stop:413 length:309 start_codon:yes stop_codon:yes gene_type:complete